jgi:hypothetical protein
MKQPSPPEQPVGTVDPQASSSRSCRPGMFLGLVGGIVLIAGSLLTWVTVSVNAQKWATAWASMWGADPSAMPPSAVAGFNQALNSIPGVKTGEWKIALMCGIVVVCAAILIASARVMGAVMLILAGLVGSGVALYAATIDRTHALNEVTSMFGTHGDEKGFFNTSVGIGIWLCAIGGLVAIVAGITELRSRSAAPSAMDGSGAMSIGASPPMGSDAPT